MKNYTGSFGLRGLVLAGGDLAEQFVRAMNIDIKVDEQGENLLFSFQNNTSQTSAFYHLTGSHEDMRFRISVILHQVYIVKEPIRVPVLLGLKSGFNISTFQPVSFLYSNSSNLPFSKQDVFRRNVSNLSDLSFHITVVPWIHFPISVASQFLSFLTENGDL